MIDFDATENEQLVVSKHGYPRVTFDCCDSRWIVAFHPSGYLYAAQDAMRLRTFVDGKLGVVFAKAIIGSEFFNSKGVWSNPEERVFTCEFTLYEKKWTIEHFVRPSDQDTNRPEWYLDLTSNYRHDLLSFLLDDNHQTSLKDIEIYHKWPLFYIAHHIGEQLYTRYPHQDIDG